MDCQPTDVPPREEIDIPALRAKYYAERDKRLNPKAGAQYINDGPGDLHDLYNHDPHMAVAPRDPIIEDLDVAVLGAGFSGIMAGYYLKKQGLTSFRNIDHAGDFGGVWYWNRYPGIQCDNESYCYLPLLEETGFMPSRRFAPGPEIMGYCKLMAETHGFADQALFHTLITSLTWDEDIQRWHVRTDRGDDLRARFVIMGGGVLNMPKLPGISGIAKFKGKMFHTSRWEYDYTGGSCENPTLSKLKDKRVAIVGTGATSIQAVPHLADYCKELYVVQRTPSCVDTRPNPLTDESWMKSLQPGWQKERIANFQRYAQEAPLPDDTDLVCDFWTEINRNLQAWNEAEPMAEFTMEEFMERREVVDYQVMERFRRRVDETISDPELAEQLKAYYRFLCKRPLIQRHLLSLLQPAQCPPDRHFGTPRGWKRSPRRASGRTASTMRSTASSSLRASRFQASWKSAGALRRSMAGAASRSMISGAMARTPSRATWRTASPTCSSSAIFRAH